MSIEKRAAEPAQPPSPKRPKAAASMSGLAQSTPTLSNEPSKVELSATVDLLYSSEPATAETLDSVVEISGSQVARDEFSAHVAGVVAQLEQRLREEEEEERSQAGGLARPLETPGRAATNFETLVVRESDDINRRLWRACAAVNAGRAVLFVARGKAAQKAATVVELVKQKIFLGEDVVLLDKRRQSRDKATSKFECRGMSQHSRVTFFEAEAAPRDARRQQQKRKHTRRDRAAALARVLDPEHRTTVPVPVLLVLVEGRREARQARHAPAAGRRLRLVNDGWAFQAK